jgi:glutaredoxin-related protein
MARDKRAGRMADGGCDILREMYQSGELQQMLQEKGIVAA